MKCAGKLQDILQKSIDNRKIFGTSFSIKYGNKLWSGSAGNLQEEQAYFIASTTKLFISALVLQMQAKGKLDWDDPISIYLGQDTITALHVYKGVDYSQDIRIKHLLAHTSGIPDYFEDQSKGQKSLFTHLIKEGQDQSWSFESALNWSKALPAYFPPGQKRRAHYSDTNFQLLGKILENLTDQSLQVQIEQSICQVLDLNHTYLYVDCNDRGPKPLYFQSQALWIPKAMVSFGADGGMVSTSGDMCRFIEAFFTGKLFPLEYIDQLQVWNALFFPLYAGIGVHRFKLPWLLNPLGTIPTLIGHSGLSGALAFQGLGRDLYIAGTVNQIAYRSTSFKLAIQLIQEVLGK